jgi:hypothetical protein
MNGDDKSLGKEAQLRYLDGDFEVRRGGSHVICAVTGRKIPLEALRYWSVTRQEPYADAAAANQAFRAAKEKGEGF